MFKVACGGVPHAYFNVVQVGHTPVDNETIGLVCQKILANLIPLGFVVEHAKQDHFAGFLQPFVNAVCVAGQQTQVWDRIEIIHCSGRFHPGVEQCLII